MVKKNYPTISPLRYKKITEKMAFADVIAETFGKNSSGQVNKKFAEIKQSSEKKKLNFNLYSEEYNKPFILIELVDSINKSHNIAVGPDEIHNEFLKKLPDEAVKSLLNVFNNIWTSSTFPETWRQTIIVSIPKTDKDVSDQQNYRPIALTSCLC